MNNTEILDSIFTNTAKPQIMDADRKSDKADGKEKKEEKPKPHILRRNIEDYLERRALEKKLQDVFDDDYPLD